jgi:hypothetical protein
MMANEIFALVQHIGYEGMSWNSLQKQGNFLVQMVGQKDRHVEHSWPWLSQNDAQTWRHH